MRREALLTGVIAVVALAAVLAATTAEVVDGALQVFAVAVAVAAICVAVARTLFGGDRQGR